MICLFLKFGLVVEDPNYHKVVLFLFFFFFFLMKSVGKVDRGL